MNETIVRHHCNLFVHRRRWRSSKRCLRGALLYFVNTKLCGDSAARPLHQMCCCKLESRVTTTHNRATIPLSKRLSSCCLALQQLLCITSIAAFVTLPSSNPFDARHNTLRSRQDQQRSVRHPAQSTSLRGNNSHDSRDTAHRGPP